MTPLRRALVALALLAAPACGGSQSPATEDPVTPEAGAEAPAGGDPGEAPAGDTEAPGLPPKVVPFAALEEQRAAGSREILPDQTDADAIARSGKRVVGVVKLCVDEAGAPTETTLLKSTGYPAYDAKLQATMKTWRFHPFQVSGVATAVCTAATISYPSKPATEPPPTPGEPAAPPKAP